MNGPVPRLSDVELDELAAITPEDVVAAAATFRRYGSPLFNALLDATPTAEPSKAQP